MAAGRREHGTLRGGGEDFSFTKVQTVDGLNRLGKKMERVWCRCWIIGDKTGSRMTAQDGGRFFLPSRTLPLATGLFPTPLQRRLAPLFLVPEIFASIRTKKVLKEPHIFMVCTLFPVPA